MPAAVWDVPRFFDEETILVVVSLTVSQKADIFISFFGLARRPPGGGLRGAFFALLDASLHFASIGGEALDTDHLTNLL